MADEIREVLITVFGPIHRIFRSAVPYRRPYSTARVQNRSRRNVRSLWRNDLGANLPLVLTYPHCTYARDKPNTGEAGSNLAPLLPFHLSSLRLKRLEALIVRREAFSQGKKYVTSSEY